MAVAMLTSASSEKRDTRPRNGSLIRGWVTPQRRAPPPGSSRVFHDGCNLLHEFSARAEIRCLLGRIGKRIPHTVVTLDLLHVRSRFNSSNRAPSVAPVCYRERDRTGLLRDGDSDRSMSWRPHDSTNCCTVWATTRQAGESLPCRGKARLICRQRSGLISLLA